MSDMISIGDLAQRVGELEKAQQSSQKQFCSDIIKMFYDRGTELYLHFTGWRSRLFAGYLGTLAAVCVAYWHLRQSELCVLVPIAGLVLTVVFWILDARLRHLYGDARSALKELEVWAATAANLSTAVGCHVALQKKWPSHSLAINLLFVAVLVSCILFLIVLRAKLWELFGKLFV